MRTLGAILAGGSSTRFGSDKAEALLDGRRLIDLSIAALAPHCDAIIVVGRAHPDFGSVADRPRGGMGPLGGIAGALAAAAEGGFGQLLTAPVDCVRLPPDLRAVLEPAPAYLAAQPVIGLWPVEALEALDALLAEGTKLAVRAFGDRVGARAVETGFAPPNINSAADLARLADGNLPAS
ncbi:NTP transferase domain-containing protein [Sphingopyxis sp. XHP0097]|uniref:NTP transferase domain-containing protein n=1 Tax=Sphingopyxis jiangsuensis TaxID=2871171 RepID=A0ABS7MHC9_9SPHN|nr:MULTISPECIES: NTP transferase domain-containing protein [Sphingopyxis]MBY4638104.1 NTP transferase domain-containing protein [Sphingopyxis jiangsuensis]